MPFSTKKPCIYPGCPRLGKNDRCEEHQALYERQWLQAGIGNYYPRITTPIAVPILLVCGAPASGKSTYVHAHMQAGDIIIDLDVIAAELMGTALYYPRSAATLQQATRIRNARLEELQTLPEDGRSAWLIVGAANPTDRKSWRAILKPKAVYMILCPFDECARRIDQDPRRAITAHEQKAAVTRWWNTYQPLDEDDLIQFN
jgi:5-methylcytosine-specific restriction protein A